MLCDLRIKNFIIIDELSITFKKGLNILTGETGAGKSILIDALSGILGEKMTTDMIRTGYEKATLEATFDIAGILQVKSILDNSGIDYEDDTLVLKRELFNSGKGRCFANSAQIPITKLKEISEYLVDIHGQNEHQNIINISKHREMLDSFGKHEHLVNQIKTLHQSLQAIKERLESFEIDEKEKARRIEFNTFAIKDIDSVNLIPGEEDDLRNESFLLANSEKLFKEINTSSALLHEDGGAIEKLKKIEQSLSHVSNYDTEISNKLDLIKEALYSIEDVSRYLKDYERNIDYSPERINKVEERLSQISSLKKKYGDTIEDILEYSHKAKIELETISSSEEEIGRLKENYNKLLKEAKKTAFELSDLRMTAAKVLETHVMKELSDLGMKGTQFKVSIRHEVSPTGEIVSENKRYILYPHGLDRIEFLISANEGEDLRQLRKVASGGEMSRIMLALKNVLLSTDIVESLVFDEVDTGISGKIAEIVGRKLKTLANKRQVLLITHLAQIAAMSDTHFSVHKQKIETRTTTVIKQLNRREKVKEVARILAGETITDLSLQHAEEMVTMAERI